MSFKKIIIILVTVFSVSIMSAQTSEYENHMKKAREYEKYEKWIYALGEYYDAMTVENTIKARTAYDSWCSLSEKIETGYPGYSEYDEFSVVDKWMTMLKDYEKYWTDNCPIFVIYGIPERTYLNREDKTATYRMWLSWDTTNKYEIIRDIYKTGFKKAYNKDWGLDCLADWPNVSVYNATAESDSFLPNKTPLTQNLLTDTKTKEYRIRSSYSDKYIYSEYKLLASTAEFGCIVKYIDGSYGPDNSYHYTTMYDLKLNVVDEEGNVLFKGERVLLGTSASYTFTVNQIGMKMIEAGKIKVIPDSVYLQYGNIPTTPWITEGSRDWIKPLSEILVDLNTFKIIPSDEGKNFKSNPLSIIENIIYQDKKETEKYKQEIELLNSHIKKYSLDTPNIEFKDEKNKITYNIVVSNYNNVIESERSNYEVILEKYGFEKFHDVFLYCLCNNESEKNSKNKYYKLKNQDNTEINAEMFLKNFDFIIFDQDANGWHLPNEEEINVVLEKKKSTDSKQKTSKALKSFLGVSDYSSQKPNLSSIDMETINNGDFFIRIDK